MVGAVITELGEELQWLTILFVKNVVYKQSRPHMAPSDSCIVESEKSRWIHVIEWIAI